MAFLSLRKGARNREKDLTANDTMCVIFQDASGWTPLMIAASLRDSQGDHIIELLLKKGADINAKSISGQVR